MPGDTKREKENRKKSRYWNEGKWKFYINPLLPEDCTDMTFMEIGCNAGLFLKLAKDKGFKDVIGIEKSRSAVQRGIKFRNHIGYDYRIENKTVGVNFNFRDYPLADVVMLSNVHYYFELEDWIEFLDELKRNTVYCLIISRPLNKRKHWRPKTAVPWVLNYFKEWQPVRSKYKARYEWRDRNDPSPRELWSFMFKNPDFNRYKFSELYPGAPAVRLKIPRDELVEEILKNDKVDIRKTEYYKVFKTRMKNVWNEKRLNQFVQDKVNTMRDIKENGMKKPVLIGLDRKVIDGGHRIAIMKALGYKSIITRTV